MAWRARPVRKKLIRCAKCGADVPRDETHVEKLWGVLQWVCNQPCEFQS